MKKNNGDGKNDEAKNKKAKENFIKMLDKHLKEKKIGEKIKKLFLEKLNKLNTTETSKKFN